MIARIEDHTHRESHCDGAPEPSPNLARHAAPSVPPPLPEPKSAQRFWQHVLYTLLAGYVGLGLVADGYAGLTWSLPHRGGIITITGALVACVAGGYCLRHRLITARGRAGLFAAGHALLFVFIAMICGLTGGVTSRLAVLLLLPFVSLSLGCSRRVVQVCGLVYLVSYGMLAWLSPAPAPLVTILLQLLVLGIAWGLALIGAMIRERHNRELHRLYQQLEHRATTDGLTGCLNQRAFKTELEREIARSARYGHQVSLLLIDIDHFKPVNDRYGHLKGDEVLCQVGTMLRKTARSGDLAGRLGGDEFALLGPETSLSQARALAERLRIQLRSNVPAIPVTLSIGICTIAPDVESAGTLFRCADQALYAAKSRGRDQVAIFEVAETAMVYPTAC